MERRIVGSYKESHDIVREVERLMNEGYVGEEIVIITDSKSSHQKDLEDLTLVEVDSVDTDEGKSFWEKAKAALNFGNYDNDTSKGTLTEYGVEKNEAASYEDALQDGNILLLVDKNAPAHLKTAGPQNQDNKESQEDIEYSKETMKEDYEPTPGDEEMFDPSKAQSAREDKPTEEERLVAEGNGDISSDSAEVQRKAEPEVETGENDNRLEDTEAPQLTGDETSVTQSEGSHTYPDSVNKGPVNHSPGSLENEHVEKKGN